MQPKHNQHNLNITSTKLPDITRQVKMWHVSIGDKWERQPLQVGLPLYFLASPCTSMAPGSTHGLGTAWARLGHGPGLGMVQARAWPGHGSFIARAWLGHGSGTARARLRHWCPSRTAACFGSQYLAAGEAAADASDGCGCHDGNGRSRGGVGAGSTAGPT